MSLSDQSPQHDLSRRAFVKSALGAAVAAGVGPTILRAGETRMNATTETGRPLIIGSGQHTYQVIDEWAKLPSGKKFGNTHGVCETADGRIFIHNASPTGDCVCEFDPQGKFIRSWGKEYSPGAHGMQLRTEGGEEFLYFATTSNHTCAKTDLKGERVFGLEYPKDARNAKGEPCYADDDKKPAAAKYSPTNIAFAPGDNGGDFYVADGYGSNYIHQYNGKGEYIRTWGGTGTDVGQLRCPHGIWCDTRDPSKPQLVVADRSNVRLQYFTLDGQYVSTISHELRAPCHFDQRNGELLIPDLHGRLTIFDKDNKLVIHLGDNPNPKLRGNNAVPQDELRPGVFCSPHQAIWDRAGDIYVVEWLKYGRVTKLQRA